MKQSVCFFSVGLLSAASNIALANEPFFEVLLMGGLATLDGEETTLFISESETDALLPTNQNDWDAGTFQVGVGYVYPLSHEKTEDLVWFPQINPQINLYYLGGGNVSGQVHQFEHPDFHHLDFTTDFNSTRLMFDLALTIAQIERFSVYAIAGAGVAWNRTDFEAEPNEQGHETGAVSLHLNAQDSTGFAYEFGGGVTYTATDRLAVSLEYLYTGFTNVAFGHAENILPSGSVDIEGADFDLNAQAVLLGLRFAL